MFVYLKKMGTAMDQSYCEMVDALREKKEKAAVAKCKVWKPISSSKDSLQLA